MVGTGGLEPPTSCVSSKRSNQLSYAPIVNKLFSKSIFESLTAVKYQQMHSLSREIWLPFITKINRWSRFLPYVSLPDVYR